MKILSAHQPAYLPWLGYFDKIKKSDVFIYLDDVQFETNSFINRNQIKTARGPLWLTVPVHINQHFDQTVVTTTLADTKWQQKHVKTIEYNYKKAPFFNIYFPLFEDIILAADTTSISAVCRSILEKLWCSTQIVDFTRTIIIKSSDLKLQKLTKSQKLVEMCKMCDADTYLSGINGRYYLDETLFRKEHIQVVYQNYSYPFYQQLWGEFIPNLSIVDFLMNVGHGRLI